MLTNRASGFQRRVTLGAKVGRRISLPPFVVKRTDGFDTMPRSASSHCNVLSARTQILLVLSGDETVPRSFKLSRSGRRVQTIVESVIAP